VIAADTAGGAAGEQPRVISGEDETPRVLVNRVINRCEAQVRGGKKARDVGVIGKEAMAEPVYLIGVYKTAAVRADDAVAGGEGVGIRIDEEIPALAR